MANVAEVKKNILSRILIQFKVPPMLKNNDKSDSGWEIDSFNFVHFLFEVCLIKNERDREYILKELFGVVLL